MLDVRSADLSIACLEAQMEETTNAVLSTSRRVVQDKAKAMIESVMEMQFRLMDDIPFTLASVLLNDSLARLDLAESGRPAAKVIVCGIWHKATDVDVGDSFWVLEALCQTQLVLVGPQSWYSTWDWWVSLSQLIQVDHLVALVVCALHRLNRTCSVPLADGECCSVVVCVVGVLSLIACATHDRSNWAVLLV